MNLKKILASSALGLSISLAVVPTEGQNKEIENITSTVTQEKNVEKKEAPIKEKTIIWLGKPLPTNNNKETKMSKEDESQVVKKTSAKKIKYKVGYLIANTNIRKNPSTKSDILEVYPMNKQVKYSKHNNDWSIIKYKEKTAYVHNSLIADNPISCKQYNVPNNSGFKSYMPYTAITSKSSKQYKLQQIAYTGNYGIRMVDNRYCVAIGTAFGAEIGTYFDLVLKNGTVIKCVLADVKANKDTDSKNMITSHNGCVSEFVVSSISLNSKAKRDGDISSCRKDWNSPVVKVVVYNKNAFKAT